MEEIFDHEPEDLNDVAGEVEEGPSYPAHCRISGLENRTFVCKLPASFTIEAVDAQGRRKHKGGEAFFVAIRGCARARHARQAAPSACAHAYSCSSSRDVRIHSRRAGRPAGCRC